MSGLGSSSFSFAKSSSVRFSLIAFADPRTVETTDAEMHAFIEIAATTPGVTRLNIYTPVAVEDVFTNDSGGPAIGFQFYFTDIEQLEAAIGPSGPLLALADPASLPGLGRLDFQHQVMLNRHFPVSTPRHNATDLCSYAVHYPGPADDLNAWLGHYLAHHPAILARMAGVREFEVLTRIDWVDALPWRRAEHMQRNRGAFDCADDLLTALHSEVRRDAHKDFELFPAYQGGSFHYPFDTRVIWPGGAG